jgi:hypothetical protein
MITNNRGKNGDTQSVLGFTVDLDSGYFIDIFV